MGNGAKIEAERREGSKGNGKVEWGDRNVKATDGIKVCDRKRESCSGKRAEDSDMNLGCKEMYDTVSPLLFHYSVGDL